MNIAVTLMPPTPATPTGTNTAASVAAGTGTAATLGTGTATSLSPAATAGPGLDDGSAPIVCNLYDSTGTSPSAASPTA